MNFPERTPQSMEGLENMIRYIGSKYDISKYTLVEIGSWVGVSSILFGKYFKNVICVDPYISVKSTIAEKYDMEEVYNEFKERTKDHSNITLMRHKASDFFDSVKEIDFIYIDGNHNYNAVKEDIVNALKHTKYMITGHDYCKEFPGVIKAVDTILGRPDKIFSDFSWVWEKKK